jgi:alkaline phosphatase
MKRTLVFTSLGALLMLIGCGGGNSTSSTSAPPSPPATTQKNVIFFLGDGMGMATQTAARVYAVGEDGQLTMDTLPETAFVKTHSNDAQVTDSAPSMSAYMTGVKANNEVIAMSADTKAVDPQPDFTTTVVPGNGAPVTTLLELAKAAGRGTGVVTTTRVTHATPASTYAHVPHRDAEADIAAQLTPGGAGFNTKLGDGVDVVFGGGQSFFLPKASGGKRADSRDLTAEFKTKGYAFAGTRAEFDAIDPLKASKAVGLFTSSHMSYDLDRDPAKEPSLAEMTIKALQMVQKNANGYFLMVEGGRIDHALHETTARKALQDTVAFDNAIKAALDEVKKTDPTLKNTLIVVTADHDHTLVLNGYAKRTGKSTATNPGVLGLLYNYNDGLLAKDKDGKPFSIIGFGNGENRLVGNRSSMVDLTDDMVFAATYHQEAAIRVAAGSETHGGTDVFLAATGLGATSFKGTLDNSQVFALVKTAAGL